jgi:hypothetical protein
MENFDKSAFDRAGQLFQVLIHGGVHSVETVKWLRAGWPGSFRPEKGGNGNGK